MYIVRTLHRSPDSYAVCRICQGDRAIVLNVELFLRAGFVLACDDEIGFRPRVVNVAFVDEKLFEDVVVTPDDFFFRQRILQRKDCGKFLIFNRDVAARFFE